MAGLVQRRARAPAHQDQLVTPVDPVSQILRLERHRAVDGEIGLVKFLVRLDHLGALDIIEMIVQDIRISEHRILPVDIDRDLAGHRFGFGPGTLVAETDGTNFLFLIFAHLYI